MNFSNNCATVRRSCGKELSHTKKCVTIKTNFANNFVTLKISFTKNCAIINMDKVNYLNVRAKLVIC